jgi:predicted nuclease of restriction endonuclease-like RecB superfamily
VPSKKAKKDIKSRKIKKGDIVPGLIKKQKIQEASYTADFLITKGNKKYYIETKGFADEAFKLRFKYFKSTLSKNEHAFIVKSVTEFEELLNLIYEK